MNARPGETVTNWLTRPGGKEDIPAHVRLAYRALHREEEIARLGQFAEPFKTDEGDEGNVADLVPELYQASQQLELALPSMNARANVRRALADVIEQRVLSITSEPWIRKLPTRLREARQTFSFGFRPRDGATRIMWDAKAGLSRLCPDDAREETQRLTRRVMPKLEEHLGQGDHFTYAVFTLPNGAPGKLRQTMKGIFRRLARLIYARRPRVPGEPRGKRPPAFPHLKGALAVLEAPLGARRDWNVHLNVLLVHRGFLDWRLMRELWYWNVEFKRVRGDSDAIRASLRELIKYSARAVAEKSNEQTKKEISRDEVRGRDPYGRLGSEAAAQGSASDADHPGDATDREGHASLEPPSGEPPPMVEWTGQELLEWLEAFKRFRRTRTYKSLFRLPDPAADDAGGFLWVGQGTMRDGHYAVRVTPLDSIPGDKSLTPDALARWLAFVARLRGRPPPTSATSSADKFA